MKNLTPLMLAILFCASQLIHAQCGNTDQPTFITTQTDLNALSECEAFQGDLNIWGPEISSLDALSSLLIIQGSLSIYETSIESIDALEALMNAQEINIYTNENLSDCCASLDWQSAVDFGTITAVNIITNAEGCNSYANAQATCLGLIPGCTDENAANYNSQATFDDGTCLNGPDLQVSVNTILNSLEINSFTSSDECLVAEGCITGTGERKTLRFTTTISNYGNEDFFIGQSGGAGDLEDNFYWDDCHGHAHYEGYANYRLYNYPSLEPSETIGHKNGWCVMDLGGAVSSETPEYITNPSSCSFTYGCSIMGISKGCSDTYGSGISCQWVDVTGLADGEYVLAVSTNMETDNYEPQYEINFSNNIVYVLFELETNGNETIVLGQVEFDGSAISDICTPNSEATVLGFNFSDDVETTGAEAQMPTAFLNEYYIESLQFLLTDTINLNGVLLEVDSLEINDISGLPLGLNWACEPQSCSFPAGSSCIGITGITSLTGSFDASIASTLYYTDSEGNNQQITLPYTGGNDWLDNVLGEDYSVFDPFTPNMNFNVELPIYGCMDSIAFNFSSTATFDDGSCELPNLGCTDPFSLNFDEEANFEDGSCEYCAEGIEYVVQLDLYDTYGDGWNDNYYYITDTLGNTVAEGTLANGSEGTDLFCLSPGCYVVSVPEEGGWAYEVSWEITSAGFPEVYLYGECPDVQTLSFLTECEAIFGCMDSSALNYNASAQFDDGSCVPLIEGCMDDAFVEFDETATVDDGSCETLAVYGCTETDALNYQDTANVNDGSCTYPVYGCTDEAALNYNELATDDDESCQYPIVCDENSSLYALYLHDSYGDGWNGNDFSANETSLGAYYETTMESDSESISSFCLNDGCYLITVDGGTWQEEITWDLEDENGDTILSGGAPYQEYLGVNSTCVSVSGCTDPEALNYDELAGTDDGSCEYLPSGCTDPTALNYDDTVTIDNGLCEYPFECGEGTNMVVMELQTDPYPEETSWDLITVDGDTLIVMNGFEEDNTLYIDSVCVPDDVAITFNLYDTYGDGLTSGAGDGEFHLYVCGAQVFSGSSFEHLFSGTFSDCDGAQIIVFGCMDETAINYSPDANTEDGSCEYEVVLGCTDVEAVNYNEEATDDDGSCTYITCEFYEMLVEVQLMSTNGNGWESLTYELSSFDGSTQETGTLETGFNGVNYYCLSSDCYLFTVPEYGGSESFNWSILIEGKKQISGTSGMQESFGVNEICQLIMGCTDVNALNYSPLANVNDGTCNFENAGSQIIQLSEGWNMSSSYVQTENMDVAVITASLGTDLMIIKDNLGLAYLPQWGYNGIEDWDNTQGYQLKLTADHSLEMTGLLLSPENTPIALAEGWNMIAYLRTVDASIEAVFADFVSDIVIVKDVMGLAYLPDWNFNGIGDMTPGQGYQLKITADHELVYNANDVDYRMSTTDLIDNKTTYIDFDKNTGSNMHLLIPENTWGKTVSSNDEIYVYDAQGEMVGAAKVTLPNTLVTLWGDDKTTQQKEGLYDAEEWTITLYSAETMQLVSLAAEFKTASSGFEKDALVIASQITDSNYEKGLALYNSVPNPANQLTEISFYVSKDQDLTLRLFNVLGEELKVIADGIKSAGYHSVQLDVNQLAPGSYFYQLQSDSERITKRLEVIK